MLCSEAVTVTPARGQRLPVAAGALSTSLSRPRLTLDFPSPGAGPVLSSRGPVLPLRRCWSPESGRWACTVLRGLAFLYPPDVLSADREPDTPSSSPLAFRSENTAQDCGPEKQVYSQGHKTSSARLQRESNHDSPPASATRVHACDAGSVLGPHPLTDLSSLQDVNVVQSQDLTPRQLRGTPTPAPLLCRLAPCCVPEPATQAGPRVTSRSVVTNNAATRDFVHM